MHTPWGLRVYRPVKNFPVLSIIVSAFSANYYLGYNVGKDTPSKGKVSS